MRDRVRDHWELDRQLDRNAEREPRHLHRRYSRLAQQARFVDILSGATVESGGES